MAATSDKVAVITGGASGIGLAVGRELVKRGGWIVHLLDLNQQAGEGAASSLKPHASFHKVDVTDWTTLSNTFHHIFQQKQRIDFVFGNAGIIERYSFFEQHPIDQPLQEPQMAVVDVNLKSVCATTYLAMHYLRHSPPGDKSIVLTASAAGIYSIGSVPLYTAAKHGVVGLMRTVASQVIGEGIRVNAICPGVIQTGLLEKEVWEQAFPADVFIPVSDVANIVANLVEGGAMTDAKGVQLEAGRVFGQAVEISVGKIYFRQQPKFSDDSMARSFPSVIAGKDD